MTNLLHMGATILCPHGGQAQPGSSSTRVQLGGQPAVTVAHMMTIAGCSFSTPDGPKPCTQVQWTTPATRVTIEGSPALLSSSGGICIGAAGPAGPPQVVAQQVRVTGQ
ncbi:hypothetical protein NM680_15095 [Paracoccus sp. PS-1]|uniref:hypothetical protein n=1 Tax=unclassified Paracoccus (in: a-proteobacteria) TaxID=2688777 RepID=UPI0004AF71D0|nr:MULTISPECIES: hypothetical protein [unclassified Paracoccus (in: a-proteobacteria)]MDQ7263120.1 hypothetical protein [Paracoccus sp. PS1]UFM63250.1 DUF4280 domain-containing protein [Paracoccus sp. MA]